MHQKQPPAKTAVLVCGGDGFCAAARTAIENNTVPTSSGFIEALILHLLRKLQNIRELKCAATPTIFWVNQLVSELPLARLDIARLFGRSAPLHVDLGCGDGSFVCALAQR